MGRLTERDAQGQWRIKGFTEILPAYWQACNRLAAYEDTGLEPDEVDQICRASKTMMFDSVADFVRYSVANFDALQAYRALGPVKELTALVKDRDEGRLVVLEGITTGQANTIMGMCEQLNAMKARHGDDQEPLITWQLYNALTKSFARAGAEAALNGGKNEADSG